MVSSKMSRTSRRVLRISAPILEFPSDQPYCLPGLRGLLQHRRDRGLLRVDADGAIERLDPGGYGRSSGCLVGNEAFEVKGAGLRASGVGHGVLGELTLRSDGRVTDEVALGGAPSRPRTSNPMGVGTTSAPSTGNAARASMFSLSCGTI